MRVADWRDTSPEKVWTPESFLAENAIVTPVMGLFPLSPFVQLTLSVFVPGKLTITFVGASGGTVVWCGVCVCGVVWCVCVWCVCVCVQSTIVICFSVYCPIPGLYIQQTCVGDIVLPFLHLHIATLHRTRD